MQNIKHYTDENYVAITDLVNLGSDFIHKIEKYRRAFIEIIPLNDIDYVNIVETPLLIKKRFSKNVDLKGQIDLKPKNNDYILEIAKSIVKNYDIPGINVSFKKNIIKKYKDNGNDLTIITNYLINNIDKLIVKINSNEINHLFPELSKKDKEFIQRFHNIQLHYSIFDYQSITKCSYETARKSLEKLTKLKLYIKTKIGKKFIYKPTIKLNEIVGGEQ